MGLDLDLVKFKKTDVEKLIKVADDEIAIVVDDVEVMVKQRFIEYHEGHTLAENAAYMRKNYFAKNLLCEMTNGHDQCTFYLLEQCHLAELQETLSAVFSVPANQSDLSSYDLKAASDFREHLNTFMNSINWEEEYAAFSWIS